MKLEQAIGLLIALQVVTLVVVLLAGASIYNNVSNVGTLVAKLFREPGAINRSGEKSGDHT